MSIFRVTENGVRAAKWIKCNNTNCTQAVKYKGKKFPQGWWRMKGSKGKKHLCPKCAPIVNRIIADRERQKEYYENVYMPARYGSAAVAAAKKLCGDE